MGVPCLLCPFLWLTQRGAQDKTKTAKNCPLKSLWAGGDPQLYIDPSKG